ncbi:unnamed protein product [Caenorhabditis angaria]|uniref:Uncharacterized protein n=1 Tax=Caenorhabditis angaria TaxID=860376 RepID=A0A9P1N4R7_9PELO|nr:unnamed protein product [Caenorhabditis angaria]
MVAANEDEKRREQSEISRKAAIRERIERQRERDRIVKESIANVDKKAKNRIVFEDSDEDNEDEKDDDEEEDKAASSSKSKKSSSSSKPKLFDSEDEDEDDTENPENEEIQIKNRHSGPKGEKLMKLETRFNSDPRFKLDDKFVESSDSEGEGNDGNEEEKLEKMESKQEKEKNRELLSKILGKNVMDVKKVENKGLMARPFTRFDPSNPEHVAWMKEFEESKNPKKKEEKEKEAEKEKEDGEESEGGESSDEDDDENLTKAEIFYQYDESFSSELKKEKEENGNGNGFSFLAMMGRKHEEEEDENEEEEEEEEMEQDISEVPLSTKKSKSEPSQLPLNTSVKVSKFFVTSKDEQIRSMAMNFRRTQDVQKIIDRWTPHRDAIFNIWKKQRKIAMNNEKGKFPEKKRKIDKN